MFLYIYKKRNALRQMTIPWFAQRSEIDQIKPNHAHRQTSSIGSITPEIHHPI